MTNFCTLAIGLLPAVLAACSTRGQYSSIPGFSDSNGCVPSGYFQAQDLGYITQADLMNQCESQCTQNANCQAFVGQLQKAGDSSLMTGQCYYYSAPPGAPANCVNHPTVLLAEYKDNCRVQLSSAGLRGSMDCSSAVRSTITTSTQSTTIVSQTSVLSTAVTTTASAVTGVVSTTSTSTTTSTTSTFSTVLITKVTTITTSTAGTATTTRITTTYTSISTVFSTTTETTDIPVTSPSILPKHKRAGTRYGSATVPAYLSSCSNYAAFTSACSCIGVTAASTTVTVTNPGTQSVTVTSTTSTRTSTTTSVSTSTSVTTSTLLLRTTTTTSTSTSETSTATSFTTLTPSFTIGTTSITATSISASPTATVGSLTFNLRIVGSSQNGKLVYVNLYASTPGEGYFAIAPYASTDQPAKCVLDNQSRLICNNYIVTLNTGNNAIFVSAQSNLDSQPGSSYAITASIGGLPNNYLIIAPFQGRDTVTVAGGSYPVSFVSKPVAAPNVAVQLQAVFL